MKDLFRVFSTANLYYWTRDSSFKEGVCGLYASLMDLYPPATRLSMESDLEKAFKSVGLECPEAIEDGGTLCSGSRTLDGVKTFCFYRNVNGQRDRETMVLIKSDATGTETEFQVEFTMKNRECVQPRISMEFEVIDYDNPSTEWLKIYREDGTEMGWCPNQHRQCGVFKHCLKDEALGMDMIAVDDTLTIRLRNGPGVDNACAPKTNGDDLSVNVVLTLQCAALPPPTPKPTYPPTIVDATMIKGTWTDDYRSDAKGLVRWLHVHVAMTK